MIYSPENYCSLFGIPNCNAFLCAAEWIPHARTEHDLLVVYAKLGQEIDICRKMTAGRAIENTLPAVVWKSVAILVQGKKKEAFWLRTVACPGDSIALVVRGHETNVTPGSYTVNITSFSEELPVSEHSLLFCSCINF